MTDAPDPPSAAAHMPRIGFIGAGAVATTLAQGFNACGYAVVGMASRNPHSARTLAMRIPGCQAYDDPQALVDAADLVFLTVPDDAIASTAAAINWRPGIAAVHCSGAADLDLLGPARKMGGQIGGFHPLQMFADTDAALASLPGTTFTLVGDASLVEQLEMMARALGGRTLRLAAGKRALYHASAAFVGPFVIALLREASQLWRQFGMAEEESLAALMPLLRGTLAGIEGAGLAAGMGGPISRGDTGTIRKHLAALEEAGPDVAALYRTLSLRTIPLALERGTIDEARAAVLSRLLTDADSEADRDPDRGNT
jgi:predicted short-subunit dehydrogenase-like oxidoreductase (DUF2520 family)